MNKKIRTKTLNLIEVSYQQITEKWGFEPKLLKHKGKLYIRCNRHTEINWDKAPVYTESEINEPYIKIL